MANIERYWSKLINGLSIYLRLLQWEMNFGTLPIFFDIRKKYPSHLFTTGLVAWILFDEQDINDNSVIKQILQEQVTPPAVDVPPKMFVYFLKEAANSSESIYEVLSVSDVSMVLLNLLTEKEYTVYWPLAREVYSIGDKFISRLLSGKGFNRCLMIAPPRYLNDDTAEKMVIQGKRIDEINQLYPNAINESSLAHYKSTTFFRLEAELQPVDERYYHPFSPLLNDDYLEDMEQFKYHEKLSDQMSYLVENDFNPNGMVGDYIKNLSPADWDYNLTNLININYFCEFLGGDYVEDVIPLKDNIIMEYFIKSASDGHFSNMNEYISNIGLIDDFLNYLSFNHKEMRDSLFQIKHVRKNVFDLLNLLDTRKGIYLDSKLLQVLEGTKEAESYLLIDFQQLMLHLANNWIRLTPKGKIRSDSLKGLNSDVFYKKESEIGLRRKSFPYIDLLLTLAEQRGFIENKQTHLDLSASGIRFIRLSAGQQLTLLLQTIMSQEFIATLYNVGKESSIIIHDTFINTLITSVKSLAIPVREFVTGLPDDRLLDICICTGLIAPYPSEKEDYCCPTDMCRRIITQWYEKKSNPDDNVSYIHFNKKEGDYEK
ncbi:MAG: hypothetical protein GXZ11_00350 [Tissierellia bacterium]|nr:hypothetical protein [Tissierellia bacterium]